MKKHGKELAADASVEENHMVIGMCDVINNSCGKTEVEQEEAHGRLIIGFGQAPTRYQTARSYVGIAIRELYKLIPFFYQNDDPDQMELHAYPQGRITCVIVHCTLS